MEPHNLKRWMIVSSSSKNCFFYTCARPGRSMGLKGTIPDDLVSTWVRGLPGPNTAVVSLLGHKPGPKKLSEFSFYSFSSGLDTPSERNDQPTFQEWLDSRHGSLAILVREHPTVDGHKVPYEKLKTIAEDVWNLMDMGHSVVAVDSGGVQRTGALSTHLNAIQVGLRDPTHS